MAKLIFSNMVSLDGYMAGPDGALDRLPMGSAFDDHNLELLRAAGTLLFGRVTFEVFQGYWPAVAQDASAGPVEAELASRTGGIDKLVVSDTLVLRPDAPWGDATVIPRALAHTRIRQLKSDTERDVLAYGSNQLMSDLLIHGLVDELYLLLANVVLGDGVRHFGSATSVSLMLVDERRLAGSDIVMLRYACGS